MAKKNKAFFKQKVGDPFSQVLKELGVVVENVRIIGQTRRVRYLNVYLLSSYELSTEGHSDEEVLSALNSEDLSDEILEMAELAEDEFMQKTRTALQQVLPKNLEVEIDDVYRSGPLDSFALLRIELVQASEE